MAELRFKRSSPVARDKDRCIEYQLLRLGRDIAEAKMHTFICFREMEKAHEFRDYNKAQRWLRAGEYSESQTFELIREYRDLEDQLKHMDYRTDRPE